MAKSASKKAAKTAKKTSKASAKAPAAKKPAKISPASSLRSKSDFFGTIAEQTDLPKKKVAEVFDTMGRIIEADLGKNGPGKVNVPGFMRIIVQRKPATKAREGINPFTGEKQMFKAKPARNVVKIRPLKTLKEMV